VLTTSYSGDIVVPSKDTVAKHEVSCCCLCMCMLMHLLCVCVCVCVCLGGVKKKISHSVVF
jgi:hypothetical protein